MWPIWHSKRQSKMGSSKRIVPQCNTCSRTESVYWTRLERHGTINDDQASSQSSTAATTTEEVFLCSECHTAQNNDDATTAGNDYVNDTETGAVSGHLLRKGRRAGTLSKTAQSTMMAVKQRPTSSASIPQTTKCTYVPKGKSRRTIFKKSATKAPAAIATIVTAKNVFHHGIYYQVGDIVSMVDVKGGVYYAQIRGLLQDQYCEKSAVITWLLPTENSPDPEFGFDPNTYIIGPEEDVPRKLDCMDFVCHAPSEYFKAKNSPYALVGETKPELGFIWTRLRPQIRRIRDRQDSLLESGL